MTAADQEKTPRIAIIGAGPIGLEAALYGRYLGFEVAVFEKGAVAENVLRWGHVKMFSPFGMNRSLLGMAALQAQRPDVRLPADDAMLRGAEYAAHYLVPLAASDLLVEAVHEQVEVLSIGRDGVLKTDQGPLDRAEFAFQLLLSHQGQEEVVAADYVLDTSGVYDQPQWLGHGGIPARGELGLREAICYHVPDVQGSDRARYAGKRVLVLGGGYSAATTIVALGELSAEQPATAVTWMTRRQAGAEGPITRREHDRLPARDALARQANTLAREGRVEFLDQATVLRLERREPSSQFSVLVGGEREMQLGFDEIVAHVGYRPDMRISQALQVELSPSTEGTRPLAGVLREAGDQDCLDLGPLGVDVLRHPEPNFFILGSKSFGRNSNFLLAQGIDQVRDVYTLIAGREDLDLYKTMAPLLPQNP